MKVKPIREDNKWYIVSTIYEPPSHNSVGSGMIWCKPYKTREEARIEIRNKNYLRG